MAVNKKREAALNAAVRLKFQTGHLQATKDALAAGGRSLEYGSKVSSTYTAASSFLVGSNRSVVGALNSVDRIAKSSGEQSMYRLDAALADAVGPKYRQLANDHAFTYDLVKEMGGEKTDNIIAKKMEPIIRQHQLDNIARLNASGAHIKSLDRYMFTQQHSPGKLASVGEDRWVQSAMPLLNLDHTFHGDDPEASLREMYKDILEGKYQDPFAYQGTQNIGESVSRHRSFIFKDAASALKYNDLYGHSTVLYNIMSHAMKQGHDAAIMENMGTNPGQFYDWMVKTIKNEGRKIGASPTAAELSALDRQFSVIMGEHNRVASYKIAHFFDTVRAGVSTAKLGMSTISSFSDMPQGVLAMYRAGMPMYQAYGRGIKAFVKFLSQRAAMSPEDYQDFHSFGAGADAAWHIASGRWGSGADMHDMSARVLGTYFKLNRQAYWDDVMKDMTTHGIANVMAVNADKTFSEVNSRVRNSLLQAGITEPMWDKLRKSEQTTSTGILGTHSYITPDKVTDKATRDAYSAHLLEQAERTVPLPGARIVSMMRQGGKRGEYMSELIRTMLMFKTFPAGVVDRVWPNVRDTGLPGISMYLPSAIIFGYIIHAVKNAFEGKEPDDISDFRTWASALATSGAGSVFADLFSVEKGQGYAALRKVLLGPTEAAVEDLASIPKAAAVANPGSRLKAMEAPAIHAAANDVPFANLWFTKMAYQYAVIHNLMEASHPGSVRKATDDAQKNYNTRYWLDPNNNPLTAKPQ